MHTGSQRNEEVDNRKETLKQALSEKKKQKQALSGE